MTLLQTQIQGIATQLSILQNLINFPDCGFDVYKKYVTKVEETCVGPHGKGKDKKGILPWRNFQRGSEVAAGLKKSSPIMSGKWFCS